MFIHEWGRSSPILSNLPNIQLRIVRAHTANLSFEPVSLLNCVPKVVGNEHFFTIEKNYVNSEHLRRSSEETIFTSPTLSTSHSIALKQGMSRILMVKLE